MKPSLNDLGLRFGTDKASSHHGYLDFYERFLDEIRDDARTVLEIGAYQGHSLRMWEAYFTKAQIIGLDINPESKAFESGRVHIEIGDQSSALVLERLVRLGPFDLVIDDGSHVWDHQIASLRYLYPHVMSGRYYILEDLDTSYGEYVKTYKGTSDVSAARYLQQVSDYLIADIMSPYDPEDTFLKTAALATEFIAFHKRTSILRRKRPRVSRSLAELRFSL
jgi:hypothetical protein